VPPLLIDTVIAVSGAAVTGWLSASYRPPGSPPLDAYAQVLTVLGWAPLVARRRAPVLVLVAASAGLVWFFAEGYQPSFIIVGTLLAAYTVAASRGLGVALAGAALTAAVFAYSGVKYGAPLGASVAQSVVVTAVVVFFGIGARQLTDRNRRLRELTAQLRHEREERARLAVARERVRIARELHDVVAHHMSVIAVQAGLARYVLRSDPGTAGSALDTIGDTSREGLEELRRVLRLLRAAASDVEEGEDAQPAPGLARLDELVARVRNAGVPVVVSVAGRARPLPPGADLCAYRMVQESLTNVIKHAGSASATVSLDYGAAELTVTVSDDGPGPAGAAESTGGGHGLAGMGERARLYGGALTAGPGLDGGFEVALTLPIEPAGGYLSGPRPGVTSPDS
jgi:signal transduction histidine kinase